MGPVANLTPILAVLELLELVEQPPDLPLICVELPSECVLDELLQPYAFARFGVLVIKSVTEIVIPVIQSNLFIIVNCDMNYK